MKPLFWDSPDPLDCYDNPNCFFDEEGLGMRREPGDPGYVEWYPPGYQPPKPKPQRTHPKPPRPADINPDLHMSIPYYTRPTPDGSKVMIQIAYRGTKTKEEIVAEVQARLTAQSLPTTIENVLRLHDQVVIDFGMDAWKCEPVGHIGHYFSGGGSSDDLQGPWTYHTAKIDLTCFLDDAGEMRAESLFVGDNLGHKGRVTIIFARVCDSYTKLPNHYTPDKTVIAELGNRNVVLDLTKGHKAQWEKEDGTLVDATEITASGTKISIRAPATNVGALNLHLTIGINGRTVTDEYSTPLLP